MNKIILFILSALIIMTHFHSTQADFKQKQLSYRRVREAYKDKGKKVQSMFANKNITFPPQKICIIVYKYEGIVELYATKDSQLELVDTFPICASSGTFGPKRAQGDGQVPEGFYYIDRFNPVSNYHLSLGINYPNKSDRILGYKPALGGDIFIHGDCVTIGCIPLTDERIKELYIICIEAKNNGQKIIPVYLFPCRMTNESIKNLTLLTSDKATITFWKNIAQGYTLFKKMNQIVEYTINEQGKYIFK